MELFHRTLGILIFITALNEVLVRVYSYDIMILQWFFLFDTLMKVIFFFSNCLFILVKMKHVHSF